MNATQTLIDAIRAGDVAAATAVITGRPEAARGVGDKGESPLLEALYRGQSELASRIAAQRELDLVEASALGDAERVRTRLEENKGAVTSRSSDGWTALHLAAFLGRANVVKTLIANGADLEARSENYMANTALCAAIAGATHDATITLLLDAGADVNAVAATGITPIHLAASRGAEALVRDLIRRGARADVTMEDGRTPAQLARERGHPAVAEMLEALHPTTGAGQSRG